MSELRVKLVGELEGLKSQGQAIVDEYKGVLPPAEKQAELATISTKIAEKLAELDQAADYEEKTAQLAATDRFLNEPQHRVPLGIGNGEDDTKKALLAAGWEVKGGRVLAPASTGMIDMYGEEVLFADLSKVQDRESKAFMEQTRVAMQPGYRDVFRKYLSNYVKYGNGGEAIGALTDLERKALSEGSDDDGGRLVPPDVQAEIVARKAQRAKIRPLATVRPTSRDRMEFVTVQPNVNSPDDKIYSSGFVGDWVGETPAFAENGPKWGLFPIFVKKLRTTTVLSNDLINDAISDPLTFLAMDGARNMALTEDKGFITGNGDAYHPRGIANITATADLVDWEGSTSNTISNTTSAQGSAPKIVNTPYQLPEQYSEGAIWLMHRLVLGKIRQLVDAQARYLWPVFSGSGFGEAGNALMGYPVVRSDWMAQDGTDANRVAIFGDFSQYYIAERQQITVNVLKERFADTDQTGFVIFERVGGDSWNTDAFLTMRV